MHDHATVKDGRLVLQGTSPCERMSCSVSRRVRVASGALSIGFVRLDFARLLERASRGISLLDVRVTCLPQQGTDRMRYGQRDCVRQTLLKMEVKEQHRPLRYTISCGEFYDVFCSLLHTVSDSVVAIFALFVGLFVRPISTRMSTYSSTTLRVPPSPTPRARLSPTTGHRSEDR